MGEKTAEALTEALLELSPNELVAIELELNRGIIVAEIMERDLDDICIAVDKCSLHEKVLHHMDEDHVTITPRTLDKFFLEKEWFVKKYQGDDFNLITTNGCFDVIHAGHAEYLERCKEFGDVLLVLINGNRRVRELKGSGRPFMDVSERVSLICALEVVDAVMVFEENTPVEILEFLCENDIIPVAHIKSGGYTDLNELPEHELLTRYGSIARIIPPLEGKSTTNLIEKIRATGG